jgi:lysophospholipase L1-like esterase
MNRIASRGWVVGIVFCAAAMAQSSKPAHDPRVWEKEIAKFESSDKEKMPAPGGVVFVGSSSIRFWKTAEAFPGVNTINRGFGGSFGSDSVFYFDRVVLPYKPRLIVFYGGENDIAGGVSAEDAAKGIIEFVEKARAQLPDAKVVIIGMKPSLLRWRLEDQLRAANSVVRKGVEGKPSVTYIDVEKVMLGDDGRPRKEIYRADGLHMNDKGYSLWNALVAPYVNATQ